MCDTKFAFKNFRMLSFKPLIPGASRHVAAIQDQQNNTKEMIFFTEVGRNAKLPANTFAKDLEQYVEPGFAVTDFKMLEGFKLAILPSNPIDGLPRETVSIFGKSGSGKSWQMKNYISNYAMMHPDNPIYFYSLNRLQNDPSYPEELREKITQIDLMTVDCAILPEHFSNALFVFDDVLDVTASISPAEMFGEEYLTADITARSRMERECDKKAQSIRACLNASVKNILNLGRKYGCSALLGYHKLRSGSAATYAVEESSSCWLYPHSATKSALASFLQERLSFSKQDVQELEKEEFFQFDFLSINNSGKLFFFTPNHFKFLA